MKAPTKKGPVPKRLTNGERAISKLRRKAYLARWNALERCTNPLHKSFPYYGGRGIGMAPDWAASPARFIDDVGLPPSREHSLDRRDNSRGYVPGNVRWITRAEQNRNTRKNIHVMRDGEPMIASEADRRNGWREGTIAKVLRLALNMGAEPEATT